MRRAVGDRAESSEIARRRGPFRRLDRSRAGELVPPAAPTPVGTDQEHPAGYGWRSACLLIRASTRTPPGRGSSSRPGPLPGVMVDAPCWSGPPGSGPDTRLERSRELSLGGCPPAKTCGVAEVEPGDRRYGIRWGGRKKSGRKKWVLVSRHQVRHALQLRTISPGVGEVVYGLVAAVVHAYLVCHVRG